MEILTSGLASRKPDLRQWPKTAFSKGGILGSDHSLTATRTPSWGRQSIHSPWCESSGMTNTFICGEQVGVNTQVCAMPRPHSTHCCLEWSCLNLYFHVFVCSQLEWKIHHIPDLVPLLHSGFPSTYNSAQHLVAIKWLVVKWMNRRFIDGPEEEMTEEQIGY